jgi:hypothetical protein
LLFKRRKGKNVKRFAFNNFAAAEEKREEADWTLLLAKDKVSVLGF